MTTKSVITTAVETVSDLSAGTVGLDARLPTKCAAPAPARIAAAWPIRADTDVTDGRLLRALGALAER
jgi:hypothetical protein